MPLPRWLFPGLIFLASLACGQVHSLGAASASLLTNSGFENSSRTSDNLWDGVDGDGYLATPTFSARVLTENRGLGSLAMPPSVAVADLNGDGKADLLVASPIGYYFYYQNRGSATDPQFTSAEVVPLWVSTRPALRDFYHTFLHERDTDRFCPRIALADWRKRGVLDLIIGNFFGELFFIPNGGTIRQPAFVQPPSVEKALVPTDDHNRLWANLLSPAAADWNRDGKLDLIVGEGTYSANSVHLLENIGNEIPKFTDASHTYIAYGDGREHLIPAAVDFNGDGNLDLLVADRSGEIGVYLSPGVTKPGVELKRVSAISFGGQSKLPGLVSPAAADINGDGLFDLVLGMPSGRIAVALNTGTKTQPSFGAWQELRGEDRLKRNVRIPADWDLMTGAELGNGLAYWQTVNAQEDPASEPPEGSSCMKAGYWPSQAGGVFTYPDAGIPEGYRHFMLSHPLRLQVNKNYKVTFKTKGVNVEKSQWMFMHYEEAFTGALKLDKGERGEGVRSGVRASEVVKYPNGFSPGSGWSTVSKTLNVKFKNTDLKDITEMKGAFVIDFYARSLSSVLYIDDVQVIPQG